MDFKSTTKITDPSKNAVVTLNADYGVIPIGFNITITSFTSSLKGSAYRLGPNIHYWRGVGGNTENPVQNFGLKIGGPNYQIEWTLDISVPGYAYKRIIVGELIRRNGIFYKDDSIPYTVTDPCFKRTYTIPYSNNATAETEFCCTLFATK
uniref:Uncharacterized protein n=1 Tax=Panagrolaimus davidi TaxID=227884 RepID=A0A914QSP2_9BILA